MALLVTGPVISLKTDPERTAFTALALLDLTDEALSSQPGPGGDWKCIHTIQTGAEPSGLGSLPVLQLRSWSTDPRSKGFI